MADAVRLNASDLLLQLRFTSYHIGTPDQVEQWSLTTLLVKFIAFQMTEVMGAARAVPVDPVYAPEQ
jgi:hypothetical protein